MQHNDSFNLNSIGRRPVSGEDIVEIQEYFNLTLLDITYLMGNYGGRYHDIVEPERLGQPLQSVPRALFIRTLVDWHLEGKTFPLRTEMYQWPFMIPKMPNHRDFVALFDEYEGKIKENWPNLTKSNSTLILGLSGRNVISRWEPSSDPSKKTSKPQPIVQRVMTYLIADVRSRGFSAFIDHMSRVEDEAIARMHMSLDDLLRKTRWNNASDIEKLQKKQEQHRRRREKRAESRQLQDKRRRGQPLSD